MDEELLLLEDLIDDVGMKKNDISALADSAEEQPAADDTLEDRPIDINHWNYVIRLTTFKVKDRDPKKITGFCAEIEQRFREFFSGYKRLKAHSRLRWMRGEKEFKIPDDAEALCASPNGYNGGYTEFLSSEFGADIKFADARSLFRFTSALNVCDPAAWDLHISGHSINPPTPSSQYALKSSCFLSSLRTVSRVAMRTSEAPQLMEKRGDDIMRDMVEFAQAVIGQKDDTIAYVRKVSGIEVPYDCYLSELIKYCLTENRTRNIIVPDSMKSVLENGSIDSEFVRTSPIPGYYVVSPISMRFKECASFMDNTETFITETLADECAARPVTTHGHYVLRMMSSRHYAIFAAYLGLFCTEGEALEETHQRENDVCVYFKGPVEDRRFWECLAGLFGTRFSEDDIEKVTKRCSK